MVFELSTGRVYENKPEKEYINDCCVGADEVLTLFKPTLTDFAAGVAPEIYQEDFGWVAEFKRGDVTFMVVAAANMETDGVFLVWADAFRLQKGWIFNKKVPVPEGESEIMDQIARAATGLNMPFYAV